MLSQARVAHTEGEGKRGGTKEVGVIAQRYKSKGDNKGVVVVGAHTFPSALVLYFKSIK